MAPAISLHWDRLSLGQIVSRVLIIDNQPRARRSLHALLTAMHWSDSAAGGFAGAESGTQIEIIDEASDSQTAIEKVVLLRPDVVVMELQKPELDGLEAIKMIRGRCRGPNRGADTVRHGPCVCARSRSGCLFAEGVLHK